MKKMAQMGSFRTALVLGATLALFGTGTAGALAATVISNDNTVPSTDGVPIHYHSEGPTAPTSSATAQPTLVFVHCWSCDRHLWDEQVAHFSKRYRVVTLDLAGHGESGQGRKDWTIPAFGQDVASVVRALDLHKVILIGHSMGGPVILEAARAVPERVVGLVPVDTLLKVAGVADPKEIEAFLAPFKADYKTAVATFVRGAMFVPSTDPKIIARVIAETQSRPPEIAIAAVAHAFAYDPRPALQEIQVPIHAINGDRYPTDVEGNRRASPHYSVTFMKGLGHYLMLEDPARFDGLLEQTLAEIAGGK
jgi:pimeloyl-ACP methyl ester carboxylesterase